jgi:hypothetical protein
MAHRKQGNTCTTISITWADKDRFRRLARPVKKTKNGVMNESDSTLFNRIMEYYITHNQHELKPEPNTTYPNRISPSDSQHDSHGEEPTLQ